MALIEIPSPSGSEAAVAERYAQLLGENGLHEVMVDRAASGLCVDPASAASVAAMSVLRARGAVGANELAVCIATGGGLRWSAAFDRSDDGEPELARATPDGVV